MELRSDRLRVFDAVVREGGFCRAAEALHVTQSSVSQVIAALEADVGEALFVRTGRQVRLTDAGRALHQHVGQVLRAVDEARAAVAPDVAVGDAPGLVAVPLVGLLQRRTVGLVVGRTPSRAARAFAAGAARGRHGAVTGLGHRQRATADSTEKLKVRQRLKKLQGAMVRISRRRACGAPSLSTQYDCCARSTSVMRPRNSPSFTTAT